MENDKATEKEVIKEVEAIKDKTTDKNLQQAIAEKVAQMKQPILK